MPRYPQPALAVNQTCTQCGSSVYCGGVSCPSISLPLSPDGFTMVSTPFISTTMFNPNTGKLLKVVA